MQSKSLSCTERPGLVVSIIQNRNQRRCEAVIEPRSTVLMTESSESSQINQCHTSRLSTPKIPKLVHQHKRVRVHGSEISWNNAFLLPVKISDKNFSPKCAD